MNTKFDYRNALIHELEVRALRNARYSMRSFARDLGVSTTALSDVLTAKRSFSKKNALKVIEKLGWSPLQKEHFLADLSGARKEGSKVQPELLLRDDEFQLISKWFHIVILNLASINGAENSARWVSTRIGITIEEAREALDRLKRLGYIQASGRRLIRLIPNIKTTTEVSSAAIRSYHRQNFILAEAAQEVVPFEKRQISSFTISTDSKKIQKAKKMIVEFMDRLHDTLQADLSTEVYTVSVQMFPAQIFAKGEHENN